MLRDWIVLHMMQYWDLPKLMVGRLLPKQSISHHQPEVQDRANDGRRRNIGLVIGHQIFASIIDCMWSSSPQLGFYSHCLFSWPTDTATTARNIEVRVSYLWQNDKVGPDLWQICTDVWLNLAGCLEITIAGMTKAIGATPDNTSMTKIIPWSRSMSMCKTGCYNGSNNKLSLLKILFLQFPIPSIHIKSTVQ